ncbi:hypothetical protein [Phenylobacterium sp.]|uniref:hypothetical protein n=1 Tax=Phenylobacterium sp. TaxID=1871053 RepID=UPI002C1537A0|nr:hypothetical protein [Phenylobacterium sp.]HLZ76931.1 hypothetical protein [Phenylobacterium sp.]
MNVVAPAALAESSAAVKATAAKPDGRRDPNIFKPVITQPLACCSSGTMAQG